MIRYSPQNHTKPAIDAGFGVFNQKNRHKLGTIIFFASTAKRQKKMIRNEILSYVPAQISKGKITRVYFYCYHPHLAEMKRVVIKCNRIKKPSLRDQYAKFFVHEINIKLAKGWNPFIEQEAGRSYTSFISIFINWVEQNKTRAYYVVSFTQTDAIEFMDYVYNQKEVSATTYNNYRRFYLLLWNYFIGKQYVKANVFDVIQKKKQQPKTRL